MAMTEKPTYEELEKRVKELEQLITDHSLENSGLGILDTPVSPKQYKESHEQLDFESIIDVKTIQSLIDDFYNLTNIGIAIADLNGKILVAKGWQDICVKFHRVHPETAKNCTDSDIKLSSGIEPGTFRLYQCKNNMLDIATPIFVGGQKVGNLYLGQFLFDDEPVDVETFCLQARKYGFKEDEYIAAFEKVPRWSKQTVNTVMNFYTKLANLISDLGYKNFKLRQGIKEKNDLLNSLRESEEKHRIFFENAGDAIFIHDTEARMLEVNPMACDLLGYTHSELMSMKIDQVDTPEEAQHAADRIDRLMETGHHTFQTKHQRRDGSPIPIEVSARRITWEGQQAMMSICRDITERKQIEETLRKNEREYRSTVDSLLVGVVVHDADTHILISNQEASYILGLTADQLSGKEAIDPAWKFVYENLSPMEVEYYPVNIAISTKNPLTNYVFGITRPDRKYITWVNVNAKPLFSEDGELEKVIVNFMDITERKQAEEALKKSESLQRKMVANIGDVIAIVDQDGINRYKSPNIEKLFGWKPEEVVGNSTWNNVHPDDLESTQKFFGTLLHEPNAVGTTECRYKCKDGSYRWIEFTGSNLLHDPDIQGLLGNYHDITERKKSEEALREREEQYRAVVDNIGDYIMRYDKEFKHIYANRIALEIAGLPLEKYIGKTHEEMGFPKHLCELWKKNIQRVFDTGEQQNIEFEVELAKSSITLELQLNPEFATDGSIKSVIGISRDVTARKQNQKEKAKLEVQLQQAQKMEAIGTLAGGIAHDFNNILFPIIGYAEIMLENAPEGSDLRENLHDILMASLRARDLVQQILTFSRQAGNEQKPVKMQFIIREVLKLVRSSLPSTITIKQDIDKNCGMVFADPTNIHQIAMNLITNSYHAMEDSGGTITIKLSEVNITIDDLKNFDLNPGAFACFSVSDTGHGIQKHILDRIFEPYFTTKVSGKGTGLGLSVVHGIVKNYNGDIRVYSEPGKGTVFNVYLPVISSNREETTIANHLSVQGGDEHILLVDDEAVILKMEKLMLERLGYQVTTRTSSIEALEAFRLSSDKFDLIITDMTMPNMTGEKLAFELKKIRNDIPVIVCTGFSGKISPEKAEALGIDGFLMKPVVRIDLAQKIRAVLNLKKEG